ncbi:hypothetical protein C8Q79DRAFT_974657 [Trametes meyenii]|nr:hypothetical protein C8Q79DRAFT_974657 [Trametes meyenii]
MVRSDRKRRYRYDNCMGRPAVGSGVCLRAASLYLVSALTFLRTSSARFSSSTQPRTARGHVPQNKLYEPKAFSCGRRAHLREENASGGTGAVQEAEEGCRPAAEGHHHVAGGEAEAIISRWASCAHFLLHSSRTHSLTLLFTIMSNKDFYNGGGQQQYYPPSGPPPGQGGYYPQQPQAAYQGGYQQPYGQPQYGQPYQPQPPPQTVYVQQQDKGGGGGCMACLAGACLCCCAEELCCDCLF